MSRLSKTPSLFTKAILQNPSSWFVPYLWCIKHITERSVHLSDPAHHWHNYHSLNRTRSTLHFITTLINIYKNSTVLYLTLILTSRGQITTDTPRELFFNLYFLRRRLHQFRLKCGYLLTQKTKKCDTMQYNAIQCKLRFSLCTLLPL